MRRHHSLQARPCRRGRRSGPPAGRLEQDHRGNSADAEPAGTPGFSSTSACPRTSCPAARGNGVNASAQAEAGPHHSARSPRAPGLEMPAAVASKSLSVVSARSEMPDRLFCACVGQVSGRRPRSPHHDSVSAFGFSPPPSASACHRNRSLIECHVLLCRCPTSCSWPHPRFLDSPQAAGRRPGGAALTAPSIAGGVYSSNLKPVPRRSLVDLLHRIVESAGRPATGPSITIGCTSGSVATARSGTASEEVNLPRSGARAAPLKPTSRDPIGRRAPGAATSLRMRLAGAEDGERRIELFQRPRTRRCGNEVESF